jgi:hypothetical protein
VYQGILDVIPEYIPNFHVQQLLCGSLPDKPDFQVLQSSFPVIIILNEETQGKIKNKT